ncbi:MAG: phage regulator Rha-like protein [Planctomycetota bacterium]|jgi:phage regulator Rha-like protein
MHRRDFISAFSKLSLVTATTSIATAAASRSVEIAEKSIDNVGKQFKSMKTRMDKLENNQKTMARALILVTAVSTGFDLTFIL